MKKLSFTLLFAFFCISVQAQEFEDLKKEAEKRQENKKLNNFDWLNKMGKSDKKKSTEPLEMRFLSASIYDKISTNGRSHKSKINVLSLNIFQGTNGALNGLELGLAANIQEQYANGIQVAGLTNIAGGNQHGVQISGFTNIAGNRQAGIQVTGLSNIAGSESGGIQVAGMVNIAGQTATGIQVAGFSNITGDDANGIAISGLSNIAGSDAKGIFVSGLSNIAGDQARGVFVSGLSNISSNLQGIQVAGMSNVAESIDGIAVSGMINRTKKARGILIAPVNYVDSLRYCLPLGIVTIVKHDRLSQLEWSATGFMHGQMAFRYGARKWYNIYSVGMKAGDDFSWGYGFGFGTQRNLNADGSMFCNIEATAMQINEGDFHMDELNLNSQLRLAVGKQIKSWQFFVAADLNVLTSNYINDEGEKNPMAPEYSFYEDKPESGAHISMFPGGSIGVRYVFNK